MTSKVEKEFFISFNISKLRPCEYGYGCVSDVPCFECASRLVYPQVKATTTLKLIKILLHWRGSLECRPHCNAYLVSTGTELYSEAGKSFADAILQNCIKHCDDIDIQKDVKRLFKARSIL